MMPKIRVYATKYLTILAVRLTTGLALNLLAGATYHFDDTFELEAGYKSKYIGWNLENPDMKENIGAFYIGANFKF